MDLDFQIKHNFVLHQDVLLNTTLGQNAITIPLRSDNLSLFHI